MKKTKMMKMMKIFLKKIPKINSLKINIIIKNIIAIGQVILNKIMNKNKKIRKVQTLIKILILDLENLSHL